MAREWSVTTESVKRSSERIGELVSKYQTEYENFTQKPRRFEVQSGQESQVIHLTKNWRNIKRHLRN